MQHTGQKIVNLLQLKMNRGKLREKLDANEISERGAQQEEFAMRMEEMKMINILCLLRLLSSNKQDVSQCFVLYFQENQLKNMLNSLTSLYLTKIQLFHLQSETNVNKFYENSQITKNI